TTMGRALSSEATSRLTCTDACGICSRGSQAVRMTVELRIFDESSTQKRHVIPFCNTHEELQQRHLRRGGGGPWPRTLSTSHLSVRGSKRAELLREGNRTRSL